MRKYVRKTRRVRRTRKGGDNKNIRLSNRTQFNNYMRNRLSSPNQSNTLRNIAAYHPANTNNQSGIEYNSASNSLNVRRPNTIRTPIELPIAPPQGYQGLRSFQNTLLANQRLRRARNTAKQFMKRSNE
jgi:hypothetical protein